MSLTPKTTISLWYDHEAEEAARFYASVFPDSTVTAVHRAPLDNPGTREGEVIVVHFTVCGIPCIALNGGRESACGWCKDRWGVNWQITPRTLTEALAAGCDEAHRAFAAMLTMQRIEVAAIDAARRG